MSKEDLMPPWEPGQSGNPNGRPKGAKNLKTYLAVLLDKKLKLKTVFTESGDTEEHKITAAQAVAERIIVRAIQGNVRAMELLLNFTNEQIAQTGGQKTSINLGDVIVNFGVDLSHIPPGKMAELMRPIFQARKQTKMIENGRKK